MKNKRFFTNIDLHFGVKAFLGSAKLKVTAISYMCPYICVGSQRFFTRCIVENFICRSSLKFENPKLDSYKPTRDGLK